MTLQCTLKTASIADLHTPGTLVHTTDTECQGIPVGETTVYQAKSKSEIYLEVVELADDDEMGAGYIVYGDDYFDPARTWAMSAHIVVDKSPKARPSSERSSNG